MTGNHTEDAADNKGEGAANEAGNSSENLVVPMKQVYAFLEHWSLELASVTLAAHRENTVYRVDTVDSKSYALRIRRAGHRSDSEINSELDWMAMLAKQGLRVPVPVTASDGTRLVCIDEHRADLVTWINGKPLGSSGQPLNLTNPTTTFRTLGRTAAKLHLLSDHWTLPAGFNRPRWDNDALLGESPLWGRFWDCSGLTETDAALFSQFRNAASVALANVHSSLDAGLIHADLVGENILLESTDPNPAGSKASEHNELALIDFDDGVFGYRLFELATALGNLREALIDGYRELRPIDISDLDLFLAIRAATYVGWSAVRKTEPGGDTRAERAVCSARVAVTRWLNLT